MSQLSESRPPAAPRRRPWLAWLSELGQTAGLMAGVWIALHVLTQPYVVEGHSMDATLHDSMRIWVNKARYGFGPPERGDIIVFRAPGAEKDYIKRVVGLPGERVTIRGGAVLINGQPLSEPYLERDTPCEGRFGYCDLVVPAGALFVMGDNRANSSDSRDWGALSLERVVGKAGIVYWPPRDWSVLRHAPAR